MNKQKPIAYYITIFRSKGHETWHGEFDCWPDGFDNKIKSGQIKSEILEKRVIRIDRITGELSIKK